MASETTICGALMSKLREGLPDYVVFRHVGVANTGAGMPDLSVTGFDRTTWFEVKYLEPKNKKIRSRGIQDLMMHRLGSVGRAYYIIYEELPAGAKRLCIVAASCVHTHNEKWRELGEWMNGFKHQHVVDFIRRTHEP